MSFIRVGGRKPPRKKTSLKKKEWDFTVNDLDAYKATPAEIEYRKSSHRSKHAVTTHLTRPGSARKGKKSSPFRTNAQARKLAIMKEVLYDQQQLQEVLEKSDTMMAVVKDLFGDDPRRFAGFPSVTSAPKSDGPSIESSLVNVPGDVKTRSEELSDSVMNQSALNELQESDTELDDSNPVPLSYQPKMNMKRFQQFLEAEEKNATLSTISGQAGMSHLGQMMTSQLSGQNLVQSSQLPDQTNNSSKNGTFQTPRNKNTMDESLEILQPPKSAMNDTNKINKTKKRIPRPEPELTSSNLSLNELRKVLETLEDEIADYELHTGRRPPAERHRQESFSGYTLAIVDSVTKLTRYLKECELRLQAEMTVREQLTQDVVQFRALVDALTTDIIITQEEFQKMAGEFQKFRVETRDEINRLKGGQSQPVQQWSPVESTTSNAAEPILQQNVNTNNESQTIGQMFTSDVNEGSCTQTPPKSQINQFNMQDIPIQLSGEKNVFGDHLKPVSGAVLLSPPVRRSRVVEKDESKQQTQVDVQSYVSSVDSSAVQDDFLDIPAVCPTSLAKIISSNNIHTISGVVPNQSNQTKTSTSITVNSVSVPKPAPLVQSNVRIPLSTGSAINTQKQQELPLSFYEKQQQPFSVVLGDKPQTLHRPHDENNGVSHDQLADTQRSLDSQRSHDTQRSHDSQRSHDTQRSQGSDLASQIAALNQQHAEAQRRLNGLMSRQIAVQEQEAQVKQQQEIQEHCQAARSQVVENQQRLQQQQLQYEQHQKLIELVIQQQQRMQEQQQQQRNLPQQQQVTNKRPKPNIQENVEHVDTLRQSMDLPGYRPVSRQTGLPAYPVSPNISPISQRSESCKMVYQSIDSQSRGDVGTSRGITVSLPKVDMDQSAGSPIRYSTHQTIR
ncbi:spindle and centriole associated protein 1 [Mactra antiquata]